MVDFHHHALANEMSEAPFSPHVSKVRRATEREREREKFLYPLKGSRPLLLNRNYMRRHSFLQEGVFASRKFNGSQIERIYALLLSEMGSDASPREKRGSSGAREKFTSTRMPINYLANLSPRIPSHFVSDLPS
jgi:hypothetical protein